MIPNAVVVAAVDGIVVVGHVDSVAVMYFQLVKDDQRPYFRDWKEV